MFYFLLLRFVLFSTYFVRFYFLLHISLYFMPHYVFRYIQFPLFRYIPCPTMYFVIFYVLLHISLYSMSHCVFRYILCPLCISLYSISLYVFRSIFHIFLALFYPQPLSCPPAFRFFTQPNVGKFLLRGDSEGRVVVWQIPEVTSERLASLRASPAPLSQEPLKVTSLAENWAAVKPPPVGILDQLVSAFSLSY
jgi:hypothetical protein